MNQNTKDKLWSRFEASFAKIEEKLTGEEIQKYGFSRIPYGRPYKDIIFEEYEYQRGRLKELCYGKDIRRLDHHKIGACICASFLHKKTFTFNLYSGIPINILLSNYQVAFDASLQVVFSFLLEAYVMDNNAEHSEPRNNVLAQMGGKENPTIKVQYPRTTKSYHDEYVNGRLKALAVNDIYGKELDLLAYADMLFWLEYYNRQILENSLSPMENLPEIDDLSQTS